MNNLSDSNQPNEKKLNIALFCDAFFPMVDGVINVVDNYAKRLQPYANVTVFVPSGREKFDDSKLGYPVIRCPKIKVPFLDYDLPLPILSKKIKKILKNRKFDLIHIHSPFTIGSYGLKFGKKHKIPVIATMHSQFKKDFLRETKNSKFISNILLKKVMKVFNGCDECWAVNSNVANVFYNDYGAQKKPLVCKNGTDFKPFENKEELLKLKQEYNIKNDEKVFLFVGRLTFLKNIDFIVKSLKILKDKNFKFKMLFIGTGQDENKLKNLISELNLTDNILLLGKITDRNKLAQFYSLADLFLFPSLYDCNSLVQIEASSQKTPTVFIKEAVTADSVIDGVNGYLSDNSCEKFADKIFEIFEDNEKYNNVKENCFNDLYVHWDTAIDEAHKRYLEIITQYKNNQTKNKRV